jgi:hypothetical protein
VAVVEQAGSFSTEPRDERDLAPGTPLGAHQYGSVKFPEPYDCLPQVTFSSENPKAADAIAVTELRSDGFDWRVDVNRVGGSAPLGKIQWVARGLKQTTAAK